MNKSVLVLIGVLIMSMLVEKAFAQIEAWTNEVPAHLAKMTSEELLLKEAGFEHDASSQRGMIAYLKRVEFINDSLIHHTQIVELEKRAEIYQTYQKQMKAYREKALSYIIRRFIEMKRDSVPGVYEKTRYKGNNTISGKSFWIAKNGVEIVRLINFDDIPFERASQNFEGTKLYTMNAYFKYHKEYALRYNGNYLPSTGEIKPLETSTYGTKYIAPFEDDIILALVLMQDLIAKDIAIEKDIIEDMVIEKLKQGDEYLVALCNNNFQIKWG